VGERVKETCWNFSYERKDKGKRERDLLEFLLLEKIRERDRERKIFRNSSNKRKFRMQNEGRSNWNSPSERDRKETPLYVRAYKTK
jgi:hypothetical protein